MNLKSLLAIFQKHSNESQKDSKGFENILRTLKRIMMGSESILMQS